MCQHLVLYIKVRETERKKKIEGDILREKDYKKEKKIEKKRLPEIIEIEKMREYLKVSQKFKYLIACNTILNKLNITVLAL